MIIMQTNAATDITRTEATLHGKVLDDNGNPVDCCFEWGETDAYAHSTDAVIGLHTDDTFSTRITGLTPGTLYHFAAFGETR